MGNDTGEEPLSLTPSDLAFVAVERRLLIMQATAEEKLATLEAKVSTLAGLGEQIQRLEADLASLRRKIAGPEGWKAMVGGVEDTMIAREADALGRGFRDAQTDP
jgi:hypothetical protein